MIAKKTKRLQVLKKAGCNVPAFVAISSEDLTKAPEEIAEIIRKEIPAEKFAVRSSALSEDAEKNSMAGQFLTKLDVSRSDLEEAIEEVCDDAKEKLGSLSEFSLLIQEFIEADFSGIAFTRNPHGNREMVLEYFSGRGDVVVGGLVKPIREAFYRTRKEVASELPNIYKIKEVFIAIENVFNFPQDIEWCMKNGELFILQSRPITSLSDSQHRAFLALEKELHDGKYYFAKTETCDVAPNPSPETFSLLQKIYAENGPVDRAYNAFGITYTDTRFLTTFSGELYVDKEKELQSLFPSHSYFFGNKYAPRPVHLKGFLTSLKNTRQLSRLQGDDLKIFDQISQLLKKELSHVSEKQAIEEFLADYELIFTINLLAEKALRDLKKTLPKNVSLATALQVFPKSLRPMLEAPKDLVGNTLEFSDTSTFVAVIAGHKGEIPPIVGMTDEEKLRLAQEFIRLREYGRWLALRHISRLRTFLTIKPQAHTGASLLPRVITDMPIAGDAKKPLGVSAGIASGKIVHTPEQGGILVVSSLTPEIAQHASILAGVIADHGGLLSHFAIIAREIGLPVVVNYPISELKEGKNIMINGSTGEVVLGTE